MLLACQTGLASMLFTSMQCKVIQFDFKSFASFFLSLCLSSERFLMELLCAMPLNHNDLNAHLHVFDASDNRFLLNIRLFNCDPLTMFKT